MVDGSDECVKGNCSFYRDRKLILFNFCRAHGSSFHIKGYHNFGQLVLFVSFSVEEMISELQFTSMVS